MKRALLCAALLTFGCGDSSNKSDSGSGDQAGDTASSAGTSSSGTAGTTSTGTTTGIVQTGEVRFVALADAGEGNEAQYAVAAAMEQVCAARGCDFVLYLGDNFYDYGVESNMDAQFQEKFEDPYQNIDLPFYVALGNHDYGEISNEWHKADYEVQYSRTSEKWNLPHYWYTVSMEHVQIFVLDTTRLMWDMGTDEQQAWLDAEVAASTARWNIIVGHHPYVSNGSHGNAGNYEGIPFSQIAGTVVKKFMDASVCGVADVYISGHDHDRQWLEAVCGTEFIVSGAGAKTRGFEYRDDNPTHFGDDEHEGFLWVEIIDGNFNGVFYDSYGNVSFERDFDI